MSDVMEFGFDDAKVIKNNAVEQFKQSKAGEKSRISVVSFKKFSDVIIGKKTQEKGAPLTDQEKAELIQKIDVKLADQLKKGVADLTEVDRLDIKSPRFAFAFTHYKDGVGTIRCLSKYEGTTVVKAEVCCQKMGDAEQTVGTIIMQYPVKDGVQVDEELLAQRKYTGFFVYKLSAKKFRKLEDAYKEARGEEKFTPDLIVQLDGDPKYQKQNFSAGSSAVWARTPNGELTSPTRNWVLDQGLRLWKHVPNNLGYEMKLDKLLEKLGMSAGGGSSQAQFSESSEAKPQLQASYDELIA